MLFFICFHSIPLGPEKFSIKVGLHLIWMFKLYFPSVHSSVRRILITAVILCYEGIVDFRSVHVNT